jgi:hypothetical protein
VALTVGTMMAAGRQESVVPMLRKTGCEPVTNGAEIATPGLVIPTNDMLTQ